MATVVEQRSEADLMASSEANSDAEAGIILRFHDADNYLVIDERAYGLVDYFDTL